MWRHWLFGVALTGVSIAGACGGDEPGKGVAEGCVINSDCASPLVCAFRKCHVACNDSRDCEIGQRCIASDKPNYVCQLAEERSCSLNSQCPATQTCGVDSQCRDQCAADRDCLHGQVCAGSTCAEPTELLDGGLPVVAPEGGKVSSTGQPCLYTSECPDPLVCRDNVCANACAADSDCPHGSCINNRCVAGATNPIGPEGGVAAASSGRVKLTVPPGSLKKAVVISILPLDAWPAGAIGQAYEIVPSGTVFDPPATLTFTYQPGDIGAIAPTELRLAQAVGSKWTALMSTPEPGAHTVSAPIAHLSVYGMLGPPATGDAAAPVDTSVGGSDASSDGGGGFDAGTDRSVGLETGSDGSVCGLTLAHVGDPCTTDCDCAGIAGLVGVCSNNAYATGSINPTPVCMSIGGATGVSLPEIATCDNGHGIAIIGPGNDDACYPGCTIDANGSRGCLGKDTCMYVGFTTSPVPVARGFCWGGCLNDQDCTNGEVCQVDLGYCRKAKYVISRAVGSVCDNADNNVNCNCGGRAGNGAVGQVCTMACQVGGGMTCPQGFTCDPMIPMTHPITGQPLFSAVDALATWANCVKNCTYDADCSSVLGTCVMHAGMVQKTCDASPRLASDAAVVTFNAPNR